MFTKFNEVYATIHKLVKTQLAKIVLKNHRHAFVELNCHPFALFEKNGHTNLKIENQTMTYIHTHQLIYSLFAQIKY